MATGRVGGVASSRTDDVRFGVRARQWCIGLVESHRSVVLATVRDADFWLDLLPVGCDSSEKKRRVFYIVCVRCVLFGVLRAVCSLRIVVLVVIYFTRGEAQ